MPVEFSGNIAFTTDYHFRGITQTDKQPAGQIGLGLSTESGFSVGVWGSNIDISDDDEADFEVDYFGGFQREFGTFQTELTFYYYSYPGSKDELDYDYFEYSFLLKKKFDLFSVDGSVLYSPDFFGGSDDGLYFKIGLEVPVIDDFSISSHIGRQYVDDNSKFGLPDYNDWSIGLNYNYEKFDLSLSYVDTNLTDAECSDGCDARAIFAVSWAF